MGVVGRGRGVSYRVTQKDYIYHSPLLDELAVAVDALGGVCREKNMS